MKEAAAKTGRIRVLMQNRSTAFSHRGGDTVLMERLKEGLESRGVEVKFDTEMRENPADYDLVHLFNFALPELLKAQASVAARACTPFVVSTLYEDAPTFHNESIEWGRLLIEYVRRGQDRVWFEQAAASVRSTSSPRFQNDWIANNAAALFSNGKRESDTLLRDYGMGCRTREIHLGHELPSGGDPDLFVRKYGVKNFVFCVGRFETRKNQLMLLKALEDSELPVVLAGGGFSYQPDYEWAVKNFKRKGLTVILDQVSSEMLASAYRACRVHALPSWYELPGLVTLEAAHCAKNVVATMNGTTWDYMGELAFYCSPSCWRSVSNAVMAAWHSPVKPGIAEWVGQYTWEKTAAETSMAYREVLGLPKEESPQLWHMKTPAQILSPLAEYDMNSGATDFQELLERGEVAAKNKEFELAKELLGKAERLQPSSLKVVRSLGAVHLAESDPETSAAYFEKALSIEPDDARSLSGLGMSYMMLKRHEEAYEAFIHSLESQPNELVPILQLLECSYILDRFGDLERILRRFLLDNPDELEMRFCLAGCLFKMKRYDESKRTNEEVLAKNPDHRGAADLRRVLSEKMTEAAVPPQASPVQCTAETPQNQRGGGLDAILSRLVEKKIDERAAQPDVPRAAEVAPVLPKTPPAPEPISGASPVGKASVLPTGPAFGGLDKQIVDAEEKKRRKDYDGALLDVEQILSRPGLSAGQREKATLLKADIEVMSGHLETAGRLYEDALRQNPACSRALAGKGALAAATGDWESGKTFFQKALAVDSEYDVALAGMGLWSQFSGDLEAAWNYYKQALQKNPENSRALLGIIELGYALKRLGDVEEAVNSYLEMHPADLDFIYALAGCYFAQNRIVEARAEIEKITLFKPDHEKAIELKHMIEEKVGAKSAAP